jgi:hypothetical protein
MHIIVRLIRAFTDNRVAAEVRANVERISLPSEVAMIRSTLAGGERPCEMPSDRRPRIVADGWFRS